MLFQNYLAVIPQETLYFLRNAENNFMCAVAYPRIFFSMGVQQIQLRSEGRENGDLVVVVP
jgi:hypothetical protein